MKKKQKQHENGSKIRKNQSTLRSRNEVNILGEIVLKSQWSLDGSRIELDLAAGALAIKRVSGVAGVPDDVVLSVLSGLVCSGTWKGSCAGLIAWWLCWRSSRLVSTFCTHASVSQAWPLCFKITVIVAFGFPADASCGSCLTDFQGLKDTETSGTSVFFFLTSTTG